jgi:hypothetical protein
LSCIRPDYQLKGNQHGIDNGWFSYPFDFDPIWILNECRHYEPINPTPKELEAMEQQEQNIEHIKAKLSACQNDLVEVLQKHKLADEQIGAVFVLSHAGTGQVASSQNGGPRLLLATGAYLLEQATESEGE